MSKRERTDPNREIRGCYCKERQNNPALAESMKDIPEGFCGICDICGKPGHTCCHPTLPTSGSWCDEHWQQLVSHRIFTLADIIQLIFMVLLAGLAGFTLYKLYLVN